jgi:hypothetical protein
MALSNAGRGGGVALQTATEGRQVAIARRCLQALHDPAHLRIRHLIQQSFIQRLVFDLGLHAFGASLRERRGNTNGVLPGIGGWGRTEAMELPQ